MNQSDKLSVDADCVTCGPKVSMVNGVRQVEAPEDWLVDKLGTPAEQLAEAMAAAEMLGVFNDTPAERVRPRLDDSPPSASPRTARSVPPQTTPRAYGPVDQRSTPPLDMHTAPRPRPPAPGRNFTFYQTDAAEVLPGGAEFQREATPEEAGQEEIEDTVNTEPQETSRPASHPVADVHRDIWEEPEDPSSVAGPAVVIRRTGGLFGESTEPAEGDNPTADYERRRAAARRMVKGVRARCGMKFRFHEGLSWETRRAVVEAESLDDAHSLLDSHMDALRNQDGAVDIQPIVDELVASEAPERALMRLAQNKGWSCVPPCELPIFVISFVYAVEVRFVVEQTTQGFAVFQRILQSLWAVFSVECVEVKDDQ